MKKSFFFIFLGLICLLSASAQLENPVAWTFSAKRISAKQYEVHLTAEIMGNWHIYAQDAGEGPVPTSFTFSKNPLIKLDGKVLEIGNLEKAYDPNFKSTLKFYNKKVDFVQKISLKSTASTVLKGVLSFMVCNENKCLPPKEIPFSIKVTGK